MTHTHEYYIYAYLDPRKPGEFQFNGITFEFEPIYIGKGKGDRDLYHFKYFCSNEILRQKLKKITDLGLEPIILRIEERLSEKDALITETTFIKSIGRLNLLEGTLCNMTNGGEGCAGLVQSDDHRAKNSISNKGSYEERYGVETATRLKAIRSQQLKGNSYGKNLTDAGRVKIKEATSKPWSEKFSDEYIKHRNTCYYVVSPDKNEYIVFSSKHLAEFAIDVGLPKTSLIMLTWPSANKTHYKNWTCKIIGTELEFDNQLKTMYTNAFIWRNKNE